jgi:uncharacterized protein YlxW (UPF0749 family)
MDGEARNDGTGTGSSEEPAPSDAAPAEAGAQPRDADALAADGAADQPVGEPEVSASGRGSSPPRAWSRPVTLAASTVVALVLGFALTVQIRNSGAPDAPVATREEDLVLILDELNAREETLRREIAESRQTIEDLSSGRQQSQRAAEEARARAEAIGILNGSLPASGPGVFLTIQDPDGAVPTSVVLDAIQELRGAGAEAIEVDGVRVVVWSAVTGSPGALRIDGIPLNSPYEFRVVGSPAAMEVALNVSGGVVADVGRVGGTATVRQADAVTVEATVD